MPIFLLVYGALYKLACGLVVMPLLAATSFHGGFGCLGLVGLLCLEGACMR